MHCFSPLRVIGAALQAVLFALCFTSAAVGLPTQNITIEVPDGTSNHGDPNLLCMPTTWTDIATFFLFNFFAHAATIVSYPGESTAEVIIKVVAATLFPTSGAMRGISSIMRHSNLEVKATDLQKAAQAGALCMVVRSQEWRERVRVEDVAGEEDVKEEHAVGEEDIVGEEDKEDVGGKDGIIRDIWVFGTPDTPEFESESASGEVIPPTHVYVPRWMGESSKYWSYPDTQDIYTKDRDVFGSNHLSDGYKFAFVPRNAKVSELTRSTSTKLSSSYSLVKGAAALLQAMYTAFTLYKSRGDQINRYGHAAFGLTVVPYAVMSVLNLIANIVTPHYSTLYLVKSEVMKEAERRGSSFDNVVGSIETFEEDTDDAIEGGLKVVAYLTDDDVLRVPLVSSPGATQREGLQADTIPNASQRQSVYVPACPRFHRTNDIHKRPLQQLVLGRQRMEQARELELLEGSKEPGPRVADIGFFYMVGGIEIAIIGGLSGFRKGDSTRAQRVWTMAWFVFGCFLGLFIHTIHLPVMMIGSRIPVMIGSRIRRYWDPRREARTVKFGVRSMKCLFILCYCAPAVGGFIVVGQMLKEYGSCLRLD